MAVETALSILRAGDRATLSPAIVISGPHAFLREYVFDIVRRRMLHDVDRMKPVAQGLEDAAMLGVLFGDAEP